MPGFSGFGAGWQRRSDENRRSRREIAQSFNEYRRLNPEATLADMQTYIDGIAGGSNYLRGGLPSNELLGTIAAENQRRAQERAMRERLDELAGRASLQGQYNALADNYIVTNDFETGSEGLSGFRESMGLTDEDVRAIGLDGLFSDRRISSVRQRRAMEMLPEIRSLIEDTDATIDMGTLQENFPDAPRSILQSLLTSARREQQLINEQRERERQAEDEARALRGWQVRNEFRASITNDRQVQALARRGDRAGTIRYIANAARGMPDQAFELVFGVPKSQASDALFADYFDEIIQIQRLESEVNLDQFNSAQVDASRSRIGAAREASDEIINQIARDTDNGTIAMVMRQLGDSYIFDQAFANTTAFLLRNVPEENQDSAESMINWLQNQPEFQRLAARPESQPQTYMGGQPITLTMQPFQSFLEGEASDISAQGEEFMRSIEEASSVEELQALERAAQDWMSLQMRTLSAYDQNPTAWVEPGTGLYDREAVMGPQAGSLASRTDQQFRAVMNRIAAKGEALAAARPTQDPIVPEDQGPVADRELVREVERQIDRTLRGRSSQALTAALVGLTRVLPGRAGVLGRAMGGVADGFNDDVNRAEDARGLIISHFATLPEQARAAALAEFERDPSTYIEQNLSGRDD